MKYSSSLRLRALNIFGTNANWLIVFGTELILQEDVLLNGQLDIVLYVSYFTDLLSKMGQKYQHEWVYLQSIKSVKHLPQSPFFIGQF